MQNQFISDGFVPATTIKNDMNNAGFTDIAVSLAIRTLLSKLMVISRESPLDEVVDFRVTDLGEAWLLANQNLLVLTREPPVPF